MDGDDKVLDFLQAGEEKGPENSGKLKNRTKKIMKKTKKKSAAKEKNDGEPHVTGEQLLALALQGQCHERGKTVFYLKHGINRRHFLHFFTAYIFWYIFWRARVCWPQLCLCRPF
jgi:hypothetical protein